MQNLGKTDSSLVMLVREDEKKSALRVAALFAAISGFLGFFPLKIGSESIAVRSLSDQLGHGSHNGTQARIRHLTGNTECALYLFKTEGTRSWNASKPCWDNVPRVAEI